MNAPEDGSAGNIFDIQRYSTHDGPGIRTVVFLKGCPLRCLWCANPESQEEHADFFFQPDACISCGQCTDRCPAHILPGKQGVDPECIRCGACANICPAQAIVRKGEKMTVEAIIKEIRKDDIYYQASGGGVTISGGEPLSQPSFTRKLIDALKTEGYHVALETAGYASWIAAEKAFEKADLILYDVKLTDPQKHKSFAGVSNQCIMENLQKAAEKQFPLVIRVPLIKGVNASKEEVFRIGELAARLGIRQINLLPYHTFGEIKYKKLRRPYCFQGERPGKQELEKFVRLMSRQGLTVLAGG